MTPAPPIWPWSIPPGPIPPEPTSPTNGAAIRAKVSSTGSAASAPPAAPIAASKVARPAKRLAIKLSVAPSPCTISIASRRVERPARVATAMTAAATQATSSSARAAQACRLRASTAKRRNQMPWSSTSVPGATSARRCDSVSRPTSRSARRTAITAGMGMASRSAPSPSHGFRRSASSRSDSAWALATPWVSVSKASTAATLVCSPRATGSNAWGTCTVSDAPAPCCQCRDSAAVPNHPAMARAAKNAIAATRSGSIRSDSARRRPSSSKREGRREIIGPNRR